VEIDLTKAGVFQDVSPAFVAKEVFLEDTLFDMVCNKR
jgi:hypothetical protein